MQYIIVTGNPVDGFHFIGPVAERADAAWDAEARAAEPWWVAELYPPQASVAEPEFTYEVRPYMEHESGVSECEESDADYWGVYERATSPDEAGARLATWVADFARKEDALWFSENMRSQT